MAWTYGNILWTLSFASLNGTTCRVDIYKRGYSGGTVITLDNGADNPFYYEEDKDSDLLNNTVRYKTGYLRLVETETKPLSSLYPSDDAEHYIEFYYGNRLDFIGFMQAQDFANEFTGYPRVVEFAIASPLFVLSNKKFSTWANSNDKPQNIKLGSLLDEIAGTLGVYTQVMFPYFSDILLDDKIYSQVIAPWNTEFEHATAALQRNPLYNTMTYGEFLDALCKAFGWTVHDDVQTMTFAMFDYTGTYATYPVGHIGDTNYLSHTGPDGGATASVESYMTFADNNATDGLIMPYNQIKIIYDGEMATDVSVDYTRTIGIGTAQWEEAIWACWLEAILMLHEIPTRSADTFDSAGRITGQGAHVLAFHTLSNPNIREGIAYALKSNQSDNDVLFTIRLYTKFTSLIWNVEYTLESGVNLNTMSSDDLIHRYGSIVVRRDTTGDGYIDFNFIVLQVANYQNPLTSQWESVWSDRDTMFFSNIKFVVGKTDQFEPYMNQTGGFDIIRGNATAFEDGEVTLPMSMYRKNSNMIGTNVRSTMVTDYAYLLSARGEMNAAFRLTTPIDHPWCNKWGFNGRTWRIIATTFEPWNDKLILTMESSSIL